MLVYVNDIIVTGSSSSDITPLIQHLNAFFALKDMGPLHYFLRIKVKSTSTSGLVLSQAKYVHDLLKKAHMFDCKPYPTPMTVDLKLSSKEGFPFKGPSLYRSVVGSLQYITITRNEPTYCVNRVCQFMQAPFDTYWKVVKRILRYPSGTSSFGLHIQRSSSSHLSRYSNFN